MSIVTYYPKSYTLGANGENFISPTNLYSDNSLYCTVTQTVKNTTSVLILGSFGISIPEGSVINSVTIKCEYKCLNTSSEQSMSIQAYDGATAMGSAVTDSSEPNIDLIVSNSNTGVWTPSTLANIEVHLSNIRGRSTAACPVYYDYVKVTVDYTVPVTVITIQSCTKERLSDEIGNTVSTITFSCNVALLTWQARATNESVVIEPGAGLVVGSGGALAANTLASFDVDYTELSQGDRTYTITIWPNF